MFMNRVIFDVAAFNAGNAFGTQPMKLVRSLSIESRAIAFYVDDLTCFHSVISSLNIAS